MIDKGRPSELTVTLDRADGVYRPGEAIGITVAIQPAKDIKVRAGRMRLSGTEHFQFCTKVSSTDSDGNTTQTDAYWWGRQELFAVEDEFLGETTLTGGIPERYAFQVRLPADALPTCMGEIVRVVWLVEVKLDRPLAGDLNAETAVRVLALAPGQQTQPGEYGVSDEPKEAELALVLPGLEAVAGQPFDGQLRILPRKDFGAEVRLELVRTEHVPYDQGHRQEKVFTLKLAGNTKFKAGEQQLIAFRAPLPPDAAPSSETPHGTLTWRLKGILARRLRRDTSIAQALSVHGGRAAQAKG